MNQFYNFIAKIKGRLAAAGFLALLILVSAVATAQVVKDFEQRTSTLMGLNPPKIYNIKGDFTMIGNSNLTLQSYGDNQNNSNSTMRFVDIDGIPETVNSSSATLQFSTENGAKPGCSNIIYAGLYWSGRTHDDGESPMELIAGGTSTNRNHNSTFNGYTLTISQTTSGTNRVAVYTFTPATGSPVVFTFTSSGTSVVSLTAKKGSDPAVNVPVIGTESGGNNSSTRWLEAQFNYPVSTGGQTIYITSLRKLRETNTVGTSFYASVNSGGTLLSKNKVKIKFGSGAYETVTATVTSTHKDIYYPSNEHGNMYAAYAEVTKFVQDHGLGEYTVADVAAATGNGGSTGYYGGWGMIVVYENSKMNWRDVTVFDGYAYIVGATTVSHELPIAGFHTAQNGPVNIKLGLMAGEGDVGITGDYFEIKDKDDNWVRLSHSGNSTNNFFNSSINTGGNPRYPEVQNNTGLDITMFDIPNPNNSIIGNSDTQTTFRYGSTRSGNSGDTYILYSIAFSVDAYVPDPEGLNVAAYLNGSPIPVPIPTEVLPGDEVTYVLELRNKGTEAIEDFQVHIPIPYTANYVPGSAAGNPLYSGFDGNPAVVYNEGAGLGNGEVHWDMGRLPLPANKEELLATLSYTIKVTEDCFILSNPHCTPDVSINGTTSGIGEDSRTVFENRKFIVGHQMSGDCEGEPIYSPLNLIIDASEFLLGNCSDQDYSTRIFHYCIEPTGAVPFGDIAPKFPLGTRFWEALESDEEGEIPVGTGNEYNANTGFPGAGFYYAIPPGVTLCWWKFEIRIEPVVTTPILPGDGVLSYCLGDLASPLTATPSKPEYTIYFYTSEVGGAPLTTITPSTEVAGTTSYWVAEASSADCVGPRVELQVVVNELPVASITGPEGTLCPDGEYTFTGPEGMAEYAWIVSGANIVGSASQRSVIISPEIGCGSELNLSLEVTSEQGCKANTSIAVNIGAAVELTLEAPGNYNGETVCLSQNTVNSEFNTWLAGASSNGGCSPVLSHDGEGKAPSFCGGSVVVTWTLTDACGETLTASSTFTIPAAPEVELTVPVSYFSGTSKTQAKVDADYAAWKAGGSFTGGCGASISINAPADAPSVLFGGVYTVTWTVESDCEDPVTKTSTFSVAAAPPVVLIVPEDYTGTQCMTQDAVNAAYSSWLGSATFEGGCNPVLSNNAPESAPDACGGSVVVTWTVTSECGDPATGTATFTIPAAPGLSYSIPANFTGDACMSQSEIDEAYASWLEDFGIIEGGCNPDLSYSRPEVNPQACEGVAISVPWILTSDCGPTITRTATFTIPAAPAMVLTVPENKEVGSCLTQEEVNTQYQAWLAIAKVEGGCNPQLLVQAPEAPSFCGGSVVVYWTAESSCAGDTKSATFTVSQAPAVLLTVPASYYSGIGKTQAEVDADYAAWIAGGSFTGGCGASLSNNAPENAPSALFGGVYTVTWTVESDCFDQVRDFSTFSVAAAPPVVLLVPEDFTGTECMTQSAVNTAYNNWLGSATFEGGCNPVLSNDGAGKAPDACGGSVVVTWTVTSECGTPASGTATFTIPAAPAVTYNVPEDYTGETCMSPREIRAALSDWLAEFSVDGGCGAEIYAQTPEVLPDMCEGGTVLVPWTVSSDCGETISGTATFTIPAAPAVVLHVPADFTCTTCNTQAEVEAAYQEWIAKAYATGGCNVVVTHNAPEITPGVCEAVEISVTWTATSDCAEPVTQSATFSLSGGPELVLADVHCVYLNERGMWTLNSSDVSQITAGTKGENLKFTFSQRTFECKDVYPPFVKVNVTVTDGRGCQASGSFNVQVLDTLPPVAICRDITVQLDANGQVLVPPGFVNDGGDRENVPEWYKFFKDLEGGSYDNCGVAEMYLSKSIFTRADVGPNQVILTVVDPSGNIGQCEATITVVDPYAEPSTGPGDETPGVVAPNSAPTLADITDVMVMDEALQLEVNLSGISAGAETNQRVTVMAVSDNPALIPGIAVIYTEGSTGRLMLTVGAGVSGDAWITVTVKDDGGTANGGKDMIQKRFKVTVEAGGIGVTDPDGDDIVAGVTDPDEGDVVTGVIDVTSEMDFRLYPNPTRGKLTIEMTGAGIRDAEVTIYTLQGAMVFNKTYRAGDQIEIDMTPYTSGVYMVRTQVEGTTFMRKVILDK